MASSAPARSGAALADLARDIKLSHSVFAMPFALLAAFMARPADGAWPAFAIQMVLIVACMVAARTAAMLANRILDRDIDARNPRTQGRALPSGRVALRQAILAWLGSVGLFLSFTAVFGFAFDNWWPFLLSLPVLAWICAYPLLKRISALCHLYLGASLALSPVAAAIAVDPNALLQPALWMLCGLVVGWVAGFDVLYALQDVEIDRRDRLHSIPARFGVPAALWISRGLHLAAFCCAAGIVLTDDRFDMAFASAVALMALLLIVEHRVTAGGSTARIQLAFFTLNGVIGCVLGLAGIIDLLRSTGR